MKKVMDIAEQNAIQMTEMMKNNIAADPNLGQHLDVMA
ncbi:putative motility protein [Clostridium sp. JN-9]|nr:putative motility protein [Clostridium sp. JN-9]